PATGDRAPPRDCNPPWPLAATRTRPWAWSIRREVVMSSIHAAERFDGLVRGVVKCPERVQGRRSEQLADLLVHAGQHQLAAAVLRHQMAAQQERDERRPEVTDI